MQKLQNIWDKMWKDPEGKVVIWQWPNVWLMAWMIALVVSWFLPPGKLTDGLGLISFVALVVWALLEIFKGVNYFRRSLGLAILVMLIVNRLH